MAGAGQDTFSHSPLQPKLALPSHIHSSTQRAVGTDGTPHSATRAADSMEAQSGLGQGREAV